MHFLKTVLILILIGAYTSMPKAQVPKWEAASIIQGSSAAETIVDMAVDSQKNIIVVGYSGDDGFVHKYDPNFQLLWGIAFTAPNEIDVTAVCVDQFGNIFIAGGYKAEYANVGGIIIDSPTGISNYFHKDIFFAHLSTDGIVVWAVGNVANPDEDYSIIETSDPNSLEPYTLGGYNFDFVEDIAIDPTGTYLYATGYTHSKSLTFDNTSGGTTTMTNNWSDQLAYASSSDIFVARIDPALGGVLYMSTDIGEPDTDDNLVGTICEGKTIAVDEQGNAYVGMLLVGQENGHKFLDDQGSFISFNDNDFRYAIGKMNSSGDWNWVKRHRYAISENIAYRKIEGEEYLYATGAGPDLHGIDQGELSEVNNIAAFYRLAPETGGTIDRHFFPVIEEEADNRYFKALCIDDVGDAYISGAFKNEFEIAYLKEPLAYDNGAYDILGVNDFHESFFKSCPLKSESWTTMVLKLSKDAEIKWGIPVQNNNSNVNISYGIGMGTQGQVVVGGFLQSGNIVFGESNLQGQGNRDIYLANIDQSNSNIKIEIVERGGHQAYEVEMWGKKDGLTHSYSSLVYPEGGKYYADINLPFQATFLKDIYIKDNGGNVIGKTFLEYNFNNICDNRTKHVIVILHNDLTTYQNHPIEQNNHDWKFIDRYKYLFDGVDLFNSGEEIPTNELYQTSLLIPPLNLENKRFSTENIRSERTPVVFIHGITGTDGYWGADTDIIDPGIGGSVPIGVEEEDYYYTSYPARFRQVTNENYDVWEYYYPPDQAWNESGYLLGNDLEMLLDYYDEGMKANLIVHSMGGLVTRSYIEETAVNYTSNGNTATTFLNNVNKVLFCGTPHHGSFGANRLYWEIYVTSAIAGIPMDKFAPGNRDLSIGNHYYTQLNDKSVLNNQGVEYLQVDGTHFDGFIPALPTTPLAAVVESYTNDDGIVSMSSGSLLSFGIPIMTQEDFSHQHLSTTTKDFLDDEQKWFVPNIANSYFNNQSISSSWYHELIDTQTITTLPPEGIVPASHPYRYDICMPIVTFHDESGTPWRPKKQTRFLLEQKTIPNGPTILSLSKSAFFFNILYGDPGQYLYYSSNDFLEGNQDYKENEALKNYAFYGYRKGVTLDHPTPAALLLKESLGEHDPALVFAYGKENALDFNGTSYIQGWGAGWHLPNQPALSMNMHMGYHVPRFLFFKDVYYHWLNESIDLEWSATTYHHFNMNASSMQILESGQILANALTGDLNDSNFEPNAPVPSSTSLLHTWTDSETTNATFVLEYGANPAPTLELIDPSGQIITAATANGVDVFYTHQTDLDVMYFNIKTPEVGEWFVKVNGQDELPDPTYRLSYPMSINNNAKITIVDSLIASNYNVFFDSIVLETTLEEITSDMANLNVKADALTPMGDMIPIDFLDDGLGNDRIAGDHIFTGVFAPQDSGIYLIVTDLLGKMQGTHNFIREASIEVAALNNRVPSKDAGINALYFNNGDCGGAREDLLVDIRNYDYATYLDKLQIDWSVNGVLQTPVTWTGHFEGDTSEVVNLGTLPMTPSVDTALVKVWCSLPNDSTDIYAVNDTMGVTVRHGAMNGVYTIGNNNADYVSLYAAIDDLELYGVCDTTIFKIQSGSYTVGLEFEHIKGASAQSPVIFESETGNREDVVLTNEWLHPFNITMQIDGTEGLIIRNITIEKIASENDELTLYVINSAKDILFENNIIRSVKNYSSTKAVNIRLFGVENLTLKSNKIIGGHWGLYSRPYELEDKNIVIENNEFTEQYKYSIQFWYGKNIRMAGNEIISERPEAEGIACNSCTNDIVIEKNKISLQLGGNAIAIRSSEGLPNKEFIVRNNFVAAGGTHTSRAIYITSSEYIGLYNNNFLCYSSGSSFTEAIGILGSNEITVMNNNFTNTGPGLVARYNYGNTGLNIDYNNYYSASDNFIYHYTTGPAYYSNLADWQAAVDYDEHAIEVDPEYVSLSDLHVNNIELDQTGTPIPQILDDIDGEVRDTLHPDIGADEIPGAPLPLDLLSFTAKAVDIDVHVSWVTENEKNTHYFVVERSFAGVDFTDILSEPAQGNSSAAQQYMTIDEKLGSGLYYYRLRSVDLDGSYTHSHVVPVRIGEVTDMKLFPNPILEEQEIYFQYDSDRDRDTKIEILDEIGKVLFEQAVTVKKGGNLFKIPTVSIPQGTYFLRIWNGSEPRSKKFVKVY